MQKLSLFSLFFVLISHNTIAGCIEGDCYNGKGTIIYKDKSQYSGTFLHGKANGAGTLKLTDGSTYNGSFYNGQKHGNGVLRFITGDVYSGNFESDMISGFGKIIYRNGDLYEGQWANGKSNGKGKYTFKDGERYEGDFLDGEFNGRGIFFRNDLSSYDGEWYRNKKHGKGVLTNKKGKIIQYFDMNALLKEEKLQVDGATMAKQSSPSDSNKPVRDCNTQYCHNLTGIYKYGDGSIYQGAFVNGMGDGNGSCTYSNGNHYEGGWKNHAPHGKGTMYFASGNTYSAIWKNGNPIERIDGLISISGKEKFQDTQQGIKENALYSGGQIKVFALIAGVASYQHMPSLKYTDDDAYQLYAFLKSPEGGALPDDHIKILIDEGANQQSIKKELRRMASLADANDVILLYLSGHGIDGAFAAGDFDGYKNHLPYHEILEELNKSKAKHKLFIADACHSGSLIASAKSPLKISMENFYNAYDAAESGTAILMSSKKDEVSLEYGGLRQGVFSHFLIKGLKGTADSNKDKLVTINELYQYISNQVKSYTNYAQTPSITGDYDKNMPVAMIR